MVSFRFLPLTHSSSCRQLGTNNITSISNGSFTGLLPSLRELWVFICRSWHSYHSIYHFDACRCIILLFLHPPQSLWSLTVHWRYLSRNQFTSIPNGLRHSSLNYLWVCCCVLFTKNTHGVQKIPQSIGARVTLFTFIWRNSVASSQHTLQSRKCYKKKMN